MVTEEIGLNAALEAASIRPVSDLGEYIIQLRANRSHIIAPAVHLGRRQVEEAFRANHTSLPVSRKIDEPAELLAEARHVLRSQFVSADVGITGANFLVAETGSAVVVTNEGNADLTMTLPRVHIVLTGIEKVVPTLEDALVLLRLLVRSATGNPRRATRRSPAASARLGIWTDRTPSMWCWWTMAARSCWGRVTGRCFAASAAAPA